MLTLFEQVEVPALLYRHRKDFIDSQETFHENEDAALLQYLKEKFPDPDKAADMDKYLEAPESKDKKPSLKIVPSCEQLMFGYDFSSSKEGFLGGSPKSCLKPKLAESPLTGDKSRPSYSFTEETLSFVEKHSTILAALVHLLCPPVAKGTQPAETTNQSLKPRETTRDVDNKTSTPGPISPPSKPRQVAAKTATAQPHGAETDPEAQHRLEAVLERFATLPPMQRYLHSRLTPFVLYAVPGGEAVDVRQLALIANGNGALGDACLCLLQGLVGSGRAGDAVKLLQLEPAISSQSKVQFVRDLAISAHFVSRCVSDAMGAVEVGRGGVLGRSMLASLLFQISDPTLAARLVLSSLHGWSAGTAMFLVQYCMSHLPSPSSSPLYPLLTKKLEVLRVNQQILERFFACGSDGVQEQGDGEEGGGWKSWVELESESCTRPKHVLELMLKVGLSNDLIQWWAAEHSLGWEVTKVSDGLGLRLLR